MWRKRPLLPKGTYEPQFVDSIEECALLCERRAYSQAHGQTYDYYGRFFGTSSESYEDRYSGFGWCQSFQFDTKTNFCQLSNYTVKDYVKKNSSGRYMFYDNDCFDCGKFCTQPYGENLLDNGGFENELFGPWAARGGTFGDGHNSKQSFLCNRDIVKYSYGCYLEQLFNMCPGRLYLIQFDYKTGNETEETGLGYGGLIFQLGGSYRHDYIRRGYNSYAYGVLTNKTTWQTVTGFFRTLSRHEGPQFEFGSYANSSIDNVRVAHIPEPTVIKGVKSSFVNGGFESGSIAPWNVLYENGFGIVSPGINSHYGISFTTVDYSYDIYLSQNALATKPNTPYLLSFYCDVKMFPVLLILGVSNKHGILSVRREIGLGSHKVSVPLFATTHRLNFSLEIYNHHARTQKNGTIVLDDFKLLELEPSPYYEPEEARDT